MKMNGGCKIFCFLFLSSLEVLAQPSKFPYTSTLLSNEGDTISTAEIEFSGPVMIEFWNMGCGPCISFLDQVASRYEEWLDSTQTKIVAIVSPGVDPITPGFVTHRSWPFPVYFDVDFNFYKQLSKAHSGKASIQGFPTAYIFDEELRLSYKLSEVKRKVNRAPQPGEELTKEMLAIDFHYYYQLSRQWHRKR